MTRPGKQKDALLRSYLEMIEKLDRGDFETNTPVETRQRLEAKIQVLVDKGAKVGGAAPMGIWPREKDTRAA